MRRSLLFLLMLGTLLAFGCASTPEEPPAPEPETEEVEAPPPPGATATIVTVKATKANLREGAGPDRKILATLERGEKLRFVSRKKDWCEVERLEPPLKGWVAAKMLDGAPPAPSGKCTEPDMLKIELLADPPFGRNDSEPHGTVLVEVSVDAKGIPKSTKVVSNATGSRDLAKRAEKEAMALRFKPPRKKCRPVAFVWTYERAY